MFYFKTTTTTTEDKESGGLTQWLKYCFSKHEDLSSGLLYNLKTQMAVHTCNCRAGGRNAGVLGAC